MKKILCLTLVLGLFLTNAYSKSKSTFQTAKAVKDSGSVKMKDISATEATKLMGTGWNLGNTMDALGPRSLASETCWGMPKTTKTMIDGLAKSGIKTIRIPVSWSNHIIDSNYTIDPAWMARVKEIVNWAISNDMYVILNIHHDTFERKTGLTAGKGYYPTEANYQISEDFVVNTWAQIALAFNNGYNEHLIFETLNEPRLRGEPTEWYYNPGDKASKECLQVINRLNQAAVDTIRESGGNNANRFIMCPGIAASPDSVLTPDFLLPKDTAKNKLMVSVHMYTPYVFAMESPGSTTFTNSMEQELIWAFKKLNNKFVSNGVGVVIGEYGATNKNNLNERVRWFSAFIKHSQENNLVAVLWDNGIWEVPAGTKNYDEKYGFYNRNAAKWYFPEIHAAVQKELKK